MGGNIMESRYKPRKCEICGREYIPNSSTQKSCSEECRKELQKRTRSKYWQKNKTELYKRKLEYNRKNRERVNRWHRIWKRKHFQNTTDELFKAYFEYLEENVE